jgi:branched-chain amino acid transport system substrate-binding protein
MTKKLWMAVGLVAVLGLVLWLVQRQRESSGQNKEIIYRVGVLTPLTGGDANFGRSTKRGADLALVAVNDRLRSKNISIHAVYEDDEMNAAVATKAIRKLIDVDHVPVILGPFGSSVVLAVAPIAEESKTVLVSASATADAIADAGDYIFRVVPPNRRQAQTVADFVWNKLRAKKASILFLNNDYGISLRDEFKRRFMELGGQVLTVDSFDSGATDFRTQLVKIKEAAPDVVFFPDHYKETALILKQAGELGVKTVFIGGDGACTDDMLKLAGPAAEGTYYANMAMDFASPDQNVQRFVAAFKKAYSEDPDVYSVYAYDAMQIIAKAVVEGGNSADAIKRYLYEMAPYEGLTGKTKFDARGEVDKPFGIQIVKDGKFQTVP